MNLIHAKDYDQLSRIAAGMIAAQVTRKPNSLLGFTAGNSPMGTYQHLVKLCKAGDVDFSDASTVNLYEYIGLPADHPQSCAHFMREHLLNQINIVMANINIPSGTNPSPELECARYDDLVRDFGGIDLQLLGLGVDGHIGFNEPSDSFTADANVAELNETTRKDKARFFGSIENVPTQALTLGIRDIMLARTVILVVSGKEKAKVLKAALEGPVTPQIPASILQFHPRCTIIADEAALTYCKF